jgi:hypothetical protein
VPPESDHAIVHSDFRIGNVVIAPDAPGRIAAVLDWELATIGDPLLDVGYFLASVPGPEGPLTPVQELGAAMLEDGYPDRASLAARYARHTGRDLSGLSWYTVMAQWKLAATGGTAVTAVFPDVLVVPGTPGLPERFFDRFVFNLHAAGGSAPSVIFGLGVYPARDVIDGFAIVVSSAEQRNLRLSDELSATRATATGGAVGPLSWASPYRCGPGAPRSAPTRRAWSSISPGGPGPRPGPATCPWRTPTVPPRLSRTCSRDGTPSSGIFEFALTRSPGYAYAPTLPPD